LFWRGKKSSVLLLGNGAVYAKFVVVLALVTITIYGGSVFAQAEPAPSDDNEQAEPTYFNDDPPSVNDPASIATHEKELANTLRQKGVKTQAADLYLHALALSPQAFSHVEKITVAKFLVEIDRRAEAIELLDNIIKEPHQEFEAELYLANLLSSNIEDKNERTAKFYENAIRIAPQKFSYAEKIGIAKLLIKLNQRSQAKTLLQNMVNEPHNGSIAETMLAKLRVSSGEYDAAFNDVNEILQRDEKNTGALLIKGGELRRRKAFGDAIAAYRAILAKKDDFDARLGIVYCLLAVGKKQEAIKHYKLLHAEDEWQQYDLNELTRNIDINVRPVVEYMSTNFSDSDNYSGTEQDFTGRVNWSDWDISISARHRTTSGDNIVANADTGILFLGTNISENWSFLLGLGLTNLVQPPGSSVPQNTNSTKNPHKIGELGIDTQIFGGTAQFSYSSYLLTSNANLIQNEVTVDSSKFVYNKLFGKKLTTKLLYRGNAYSDENTAREFEGTLLLALNKSAPLFSIGYAYRYLNFLQPSNLGYFDPQDYAANKLLLLAAYEHGPFYLYAEYVSGRQTYLQKLAKKEDNFNHVGATTGTTLWKGFRMEFSVEKNNSAADGGSDYAYGDMSYSWRVSYTL